MSGQCKELTTFNEKQVKRNQEWLIAWTAVTILNVSVFVFHLIVGAHWLLVVANLPLVALGLMRIWDMVGDTKYRLKVIKEDVSFNTKLECANLYQEQMKQVLRELHPDNKKLPFCDHPMIPLPFFDAKKAENMTWEEVNKMFPPVTADCPSCGANVTKFASDEHYHAGHW